MGSSESRGYRARQRERERQRREQESRRRQGAEQTPPTKAGRAPHPGGGGRATRPSGPPAGGRGAAGGGAAAGRQGRRGARGWGGRSRATGRGPDLWVVRRTDHPDEPWTDPQVVFGYLPTPSLGQDAGHEGGVARG